MNRTLVNAGLLIATTAGSQLALTVTLIAVARTMGASEYGFIMGWYGLAMIVTAVLDSGLNLIVVRDIGRHPERMTSFPVAFGTKVVTSSLVCLFWLGAGLWVASAFGAPDWVAVGLLGPLIVCEDLVNTLAIPHRALEQMAPVGSIALLQRGSQAGCVLVLTAVLDLGLSGFIGGMILGSVVAIAARLRSLPPDLRRPRWPAPAEYASRLRHSRHFASLSLASNGNRLDVPLIGLVVGNQAAGFYAVATRFGAGFNIISAGLNTSLYARLNAMNDPLRNRALLRQVLTGLAIGLSVIVIVFALVAPWLVPLLFGEDYRGAVNVSRLYVAGMALGIINSTISTFYQSSGREGSTSVVVTVGLTIGLLSIAVASLIAGPAGGAIGFIALQVVTSLLLWRVWNARVPGHPDAIGLKGIQWDRR